MQDRQPITSRRGLTTLTGHQTAVQTHDGFRQRSFACRVVSVLILGITPAVGYQLGRIVVQVILYLDTVRMKHLIDVAVVFEPPESVQESVPRLVFGLGARLVAG